MDWINKYFWELLFGFRLSMAGEGGGGSTVSDDANIEGQGAVTADPGLPRGIKDIPVQVPAADPAEGSGAEQQGGNEPEPSKDDSQERYWHAHFTDPSDAGSLIRAWVGFFGTAEEHALYKLDLEKSVKVASLTRGVGGPGWGSTTEVEAWYKSANGVFTGTQFYFPNGGHPFANSEKLESVSLYKTIDLISEGPIEGLCDQKGEVAPLSLSSKENEGAFKGIYFNDVPVKNTHTDTINYMRTFAEIKKGTLTQGPLSSSVLYLPGTALRDQHSLAFGVSSQTFNVGVKLPGLNTREFDDLVNFNSSGTAQFFGTGYNYDFKSFSLEKGSYHTKDYSISKNANRVSAFTDRSGKTNSTMVERIKRAMAANPVKFHHVITNDNVNDIELTLEVMQLSFRKIKEPDLPPLGNTALFLAKISYMGDERLIGEGGSAIYLAIPITGVATSSYLRSYQFKLPPALEGTDRQVSVIAAMREPHPNDLATGGISRMSGVKSITEMVDAPFSYPHSALVCNLIDARSFASIPRRTYDMKLLKIQVPSNYDPTNKIYNGNWAGEFAGTRRWSDNPAWVFYDMVVNNRYGLAKYGLDADVVDKWNLYSIGKYCDELVETGFNPSTEPLDFTVGPNGAVITINDSNSKWGEEKLRQAFPVGGIVALFKIKNSSGTALGQGFRRRVGNVNFNTTSNLFTFTIHKPILPQLVFENFVRDESGKVVEWLRRDFLNYKGASTEKLSAYNWLISRIQEQAGRKPEDRDAFVSEYMQGFTLGEAAAEGKAVVEADLARPVLEARFSTNIYLDKEQEAYNLLNDLAAVFRGMIYWNSGFVFVANDQLRDAIAVFNNSNVKDGAFVYSGSSKTTRFTAVLVRYNDRYDSFKPKIEYVEDPIAMRKYGYLDKKILALGTTSEGQANRLGKWFLFTNQLETDLVQFTTSVEATYLRPGDVIKIQDTLKSTKRYGGRLAAVNSSSFQVTLDQGVYEDVVGQKITLITPKPKKSATELTRQAAEGDGEGFSASEISRGATVPQITQFTIAAVGASTDAGGAQNDLITIADTDSEEFSSVEVGTLWTLENTAEDYEIKAVEYRVLSVADQSSGEYLVTGMMYHRSKFNAIDESKDLSATQQSKTLMSAVNVAARPSSLDLDGYPPEIESIDFVSTAEPSKKATFSFEETTEGAQQNVMQATVSFDNAAAQLDTGTETAPEGYVVEVEVNGQTQAAILAGADNTSFTIQAGSEDDLNSITYTVSTYNSTGVEASLASVPPGGDPP
jgi:predicted phage tail protein